MDRSSKLVKLALETYKSQQQHNSGQLDEKKENIGNNRVRESGIQDLKNEAWTDVPINNAEEGNIDIQNLPFIFLDNDVTFELNGAGQEEGTVLEDGRENMNIEIEIDEPIQCQINIGTSLEFSPDNPQPNLYDSNDDSVNNVHLEEIETSLELSPNNLQPNLHDSNDDSVNNVHLEEIETSLELSPNNLQPNLHDSNDDSVNNVDLEENENRPRPTNDLNETNNVSKKRKKGVGPWVRTKRLDRKTNRNYGNSYTTAKGKEISERKMKELKKCRMECSKTLSDEVRQKIFDEYWALGSRDRRVQFLGSMIEVQGTKVTRKRKEDSSKNRDVTFYYNFDICGQRKRVCKSCFTNTLAENNKFIALAVANKMKTTSGTTSLDQRGLHPPSNKMPQEEIDAVISQIKSFPMYESHYTRKTNDKLYLPSHLNLTKMYSLYCDETENPVSRGIYEREFHKLNLRFKPRKTDTCHKCEVFKMKLQACESEDERKQTLDLQKIHQEAADSAYESKKKDKELAEKDDSIKCFAFDLQQCLPTPDLQTSVSFYKRLYWTYNLSFHDLATNEATCYLWHEAVANRGANEIASCIYKEMLDLPDSVKTVILYSDTCGGQNKNSHVASMFTYLLQVKPTINEIHHKFLVPGHTHMECDADHSVIERQKKKTQSLIAHPHDWATLIRCSNKKFKVVEMEQEEFFDFAALLKGPLVLRKNNSSGEKFLWRPCRWFRYSNDFGEVSYKTSLNQEENYYSFSL